MREIPDLRLIFRGIKIKFEKTVDKRLKTCYNETNDRGASKRSIDRAIACAGVAVEKGFGAEGRSERADGPGIADKIRRAVAEMRRAI